MSSFYNTGWKSARVITTNSSTGSIDWTTTAGALPIYTNSLDNEALYSNIFIISGSDNTIIGLPSGSNQTMLGSGGTFDWDNFGTGLERWGNTISKITPTLVNSANFGVSIAYKSTTPTYFYPVNATDFNFTVPTNAVITGILLQIMAEWEDAIYINNIQMKLFYNFERSLSKLWSITNPGATFANCSLNTLAGGPSTVVSLGNDFEFPNNWVRYSTPNYTLDAQLLGGDLTEVQIESGTYGTYASAIYDTYLPVIGVSTDTAFLDYLEIGNWDGGTGNIRWALIQNTGKAPVQLQIAGTTQFNDFFNNLITFNSTTDATVTGL